MSNSHGRRPTRDECIRAAGHLLAQMQVDVLEMTPREQAEAAWTPTSGLTVDELEDRIRVRRGLDPIHSTNDDVPSP